MDIIKEIQNQLSNEDIYFEMITDYIIKIHIEDSVKYINFEPEEIYTNIESFVNYLEEYSEAGVELPAMRIPFFAGISPAELGHFLLGPGQTFGNYSKEVEYSTVPANFNINGSKFFCEYLDYLYTLEEVKDGKNNFKNHIDNLVLRIKELSWSYNLIIPLEIRLINQGSISMQELHKALIDAEED